MTHKSTTGWTMNTRPCAAVACESQARVRWAPVGAHRSLRRVQL